MDQQSSDLYGSAQLIERVFSDIARPLLQPKCSEMLLGHNEEADFMGLSYNLNAGADPGHALTFGATRSGKGVNTIIPALLTYGGSVVVIDPKGENAWITGRYRSEFSRVVILDPWNEVNERYGNQVGESVIVTKFNPLSVLDPHSRDFNDDVVAIADALTVKSADLESHWTDSARELIAGLIAAAVEANPGKASLRDVRELITAEDETLLAAITKIREANPNSLGARKLRRFTPKVRYDREGNALPIEESREIGSIRSTAETQTAVLDSESLLDAMETDAPPFDLTELSTSTVSLYLVLPVDKLETHGRWLRLILTQTLRTISRQRKLPALPVLFMLDEMGTIGNLRMVEQSFGLMAGLGIRIWGFLQDLSQLQRDYPKTWETFWSNSSIVQVLNCGDLTTSEHVSKYLGTMTVNAKTGTYTFKQVMWRPGEYENRVHELAFSIAGLSSDLRQDPQMRAKDLLRERGLTVEHNQAWTPDEQLASRPVLYPNEVRDSPSDFSIIIRPGRGNFRLKRFEYFSHPLLSVRARHDPNKPNPILKDRPQDVAAKAAAAAPQQSPAPVAAPEPPPPMKPQTMGDELADLGKDLGKKAAGAAVSFLKDRLKR